MWCNICYVWCKHVTWVTSPLSLGSLETIFSSFSSQRQWRLVSFIIVSRKLMTPKLSAKAIAWVTWLHWLHTSNMPQDLKGYIDLNPPKGISGMFVDGSMNSINSMNSLTGVYINGALNSLIPAKLYCSALEEPIKPIKLVEDCRTEGTQGTEPTERTGLSILSRITASIETIQGTSRPSSAQICSRSWSFHSESIRREKKSLHLFV